MSTTLKYIYSIEFINMSLILRKSSIKVSNSSSTFEMNI